MYTFVMLANYGDRAQQGDVYMLVLYGAMALILGFGIGVAILRWALRVNDMVEYQRQTAQHLAALQKHFAPQEPMWRREE
jgi:uncharacterized membrane-anchored protein YhcB (DUF1043 family)